VLQVNPNKLSDLQLETCVSSFQPVRTDKYVGKSESKVVDKVRIQCEIIIPGQFMTNFQIQVGTLESQVYLRL